MYNPDNIFAKILRGELPSYKVYEDEYTFVMLDIFPQSYGHTLVLPKSASENFLEMTLEEAQHCIKTLKKVGPILKELTQADGMILTQFNGAEAGQTVFHTHFHLIPKYKEADLHPHAKNKADENVLKSLQSKLIKALS